jgi:hypothetical protein
VIGCARLESGQRVGVFDFPRNYDQRKIDALFLDDAQGVERTEVADREIANGDIAVGAEHAAELLLVDYPLKRWSKAARFEFSGYYVRAGLANKKHTQWL